MLLYCFNVINCSIITPRLKGTTDGKKPLITYKFALIMPL
jgi:hypothetical protein